MEREALWRRALALEHASVEHGAEDQCSLHRGDLYQLGLGVGCGGKEKVEGRGGTES